MKRKMILPAVVVLLLAAALTGVLAACADKTENTGVFASGAVPVQDVYGNWGYADSNGEVLIPCEYRSATAFRGGYAAVEAAAGVWYVINTSGERVQGPFASVRIFGDSAVFEDYKTHEYYFYTFSTGERGEGFDGYVYDAENAFVRTVTSTGDNVGGRILEYRAVKDGVVAGDGTAYYLTGNDVFYELGGKVLTGRRTGSSRYDFTLLDIAEGTTTAYADASVAERDFAVPDTEKLNYIVLSSENAETGETDNSFISSAAQEPGVADVARIDGTDGLTYVRISYADGQTADKYMLFSAEEVLCELADDGLTRVGEAFFSLQDGTYTFYTEDGKFTHKPAPAADTTLSVADCAFIGGSTLVVTYRVENSASGETYTQKAAFTSAGVTDLQMFEDMNLTVTDAADGFFVVRNNGTGRYGVADLSGSIVAETVYTGVRPLEGGFWAVKMGGAESVYKTGTGELMPFVFSAVCPEEAL